MDGLDEFKKLLKEDYQRTIQLLTLLQREKTALVKIDTPKLEALALEKRKLFDVLEKNIQQRSNLLRQFGIEDSPVGIEVLIAHHAGNQKQELNQLWQQFTKQLHTCRTHNQINGTMLMVTMHNTRQMLNIMFGQSGKENIYGPQGQLQSQAPSQGHTKA